MRGGDVIDVGSRVQHCANAVGSANLIKAADNKSLP